MIYFDVHAHIGFTVSRARLVGQTIGRYLSRMASSRVPAAIISPTAGGPQARGVLDTRSQHEAIKAAIDLYPDRFPIGLGIVEVRHEKAGADELERCMSEDGLMGFMCHPGLSGHTLEGELHPYLEIVAMHKGICLLHQSGSTSKIAAYARRFPQVSFIIGHASMSREGHKDVIEHCQSVENIWYDIAQKRDTGESDWDLSDLVQNLGDERIFFGSDAPYYDYRLLQKLIEDSDIGDESKDRIASENAVAFVQKFRPKWKLPSTEVVPPQKYTDEEMWASQGARLL